MITLDATLVFFVIVTAAIYLTYSALGRRRGGSCGGSSCGDQCRIRNSALKDD